MKKILLILLGVFSSLSSFAFNKADLVDVLTKEIKSSVINKNIIVEEIKFIGFEPQESCVIENLKIREIKRPSSVEFTFYCAKRQYRAIAKYEILTTVYVSKRVLKKGETINEEDILEINQSLQRVPDGAITDKASIIGKVIKRTITNGLIIKENYLYSNMPVKKGSRVNLIISSGNVIIMTEGVLKSDAVVGGNAKIQCLQTGKEVVGELVDKNIVRVWL